MTGNHWITIFKINIDLYNLLQLLQKIPSPMASDGLIV